MSSNDGNYALILLFSFVGIFIVGFYFLWKNRFVFGLATERRLVILIP
jgi:hypothetical protein